MDSYTVVGNYTVDARMIDADGNKGSWTRDVDDNTWYELGGDSGQKSGSSVRVQSSNDWTTPVAVRVTGRWKSN